MKIQACLTNNNDLWQTPSKLYQWFIQKGWYDPCPVNPQFDGLTTEWQKLNFVNPPYSEIDKWVDKAIEESKKAKETTLLIPARTDTQWFKKLYDHGVLIQLLNGRLKFNDGKFTAPFPSMLVTIPSYPRYKTDIYLLNKNERFWENEN